MTHGWHYSDLSFPLPQKGFYHIHAFVLASLKWVLVWHPCEEWKMHYPPNRNWRSSDLSRLCIRCPRLLHYTRGRKLADPTPTIPAGPGVSSHEHVFAIRRHVLRVWLQFLGMLFFEKELTALPSSEVSSTMSCSRFRHLSATSKEPDDERKKTSIFIISNPYSEAKWGLIRKMGRILWRVPCGCWSKLADATLNFIRWLATSVLKMFENVPLLHRNISASK